MTRSPPGGGREPRHPAARGLRGADDAARGGATTDAAGPSPMAAALAGEPAAPAPRPVLPALRLVLAVASAVLLLALMGVTVVDVAGRYLLSRPLPGATEITELLLCATIFTGLPAVCLDDGHVTVDLVTSRLERRPAALRLAAARLVTAAALAVIGWRLAVQGGRLAGYGETSVYLRLPVAPLAFLAAGLCLGAAAAALALVALRAGEGGTRR